MQDSDVFFLTNGNKTLTGIDEMKCPAELQIPYGVTKIDKRALADCPAKKIFLPDTVTEIGYEAFSGCDALEYVRLSKNLKTIGQAAFRGCFSLSQIEIGENCPNYSESLFECCYSLPEIPFSKGMTEVQRNAFSECVSIESLEFPEGIVVIRSGAAGYCQNLTSIVLPSTLRIIEDDAFRNCPKLSEIRIEGDNPAFFIEEDSGCLFARRDDGYFTLIKVPCNATEIRIPKTVTHSHGEAFSGCDSLEKVYIDCEFIDHPLFVALKTEIVNAKFIDETKPEVIEADVEAEAVEDKTIAVAEEPAVEETETEVGAEAVEDKTIAVAEEPAVEETETEVEAEAVEDKTIAVAEEPAVEKTETETEADAVVEEPQIEEPVIEESASIEEPEIEEPIIEDSLEETAVDEPVIEEEASFDDSIFEESLLDEPDEPNFDNFIFEEDEAEADADAESIAADILADVMEESREHEEIFEQEEEEELKGILISPEEFDEAVARGIQEEEEKDWKVPEGFFPQKAAAAEEEPEYVPPQEPRFVNGLQSVSAACEIIGERALYPDRAESELCAAAPNEMEDITTLVVVTESVTENNEISAALKKFCIELAKKHNLLRVYFFGAVGLDNDELVYGFGNFALYRNVVYAARCADYESLSAEQKSFAEAAEIPTPSTPFQNVCNAEIAEVEKPFKIFVQDDTSIGASKAKSASAEETPQTSQEAALERPALSGRGLLQKAKSALDAQK